MRSVIVSGPCSPSSFTSIFLLSSAFRISTVPPHSPFHLILQTIHRQTCPSSCCNLPFLKSIVFSILATLQHSSWSWNWVNCGHFSLMVTHNQCYLLCPPHHWGLGLLILFDLYIFLWSGCPYVGVEFSRCMGTHVSSQSLGGWSLRQ